MWYNKDMKGRGVMKKDKTFTGSLMAQIFIVCVLAGMAYTLIHEGVKLCVWSYDKIYRAPLGQVYIASQPDAYYHSYRNCEGLSGTSNTILVDYDTLFRKSLAACSYCENSYEKEVRYWIRYTNAFLDGIHYLDYSWHKGDSNDTFTLTLKLNGNSYISAITFFRENDWTGRNDKQLSHVTIYSFFDVRTRYNYDYCRQVSILYDLGYNYLNSRGVIIHDEWATVKDESTVIMMKLMEGKEDLAIGHKFKSGGGGGIFEWEDDKIVCITFSINE